MSKWDEVAEELQGLFSKLLPDFTITVERNNLDWRIKAKRGDFMRECGVSAETFQEDFLKYQAETIDAYYKMWLEEEIETKREPRIILRTPFLSPGIMRGHEEPRTIPDWLTPGSDRRPMNTSGLTFDTLAQVVREFKEQHPTVYFVASTAVPVEADGEPAIWQIMPYFDLEAGRVLVFHPDNMELVQREMNGRALLVDYRERMEKKMIAYVFRPSFSWSPDTL